MLATAGIATLVALFLILFLVIRDTPISFEKAATNPQLREKFTARMLERFPLPSNVEYVTNGTVEDILKVAPHYTKKPLDTMVTVSLRTEEQKQIFGIFILPQAFSREHIQTEEDFAGALLHEYDHARMFREEGFTTLIRGFVPLSEFQHTELYVPLTELYAIQGELQQLTQANSQSYRKTIQQRYMNLYIKLWNSGAMLEESLRSDLKVEFFPLCIYSLTLEQIQNPLGISSSKGERFELTPQEVEKLRRRFLQK